MNEKDLREIRRRFRPDKSNIPSIVGCFVNANGEIISKINQSILMSETDESEALLSVMKKTLSGSLGTNLIDIEFSTKNVLESEEHKLLMSLKESKLSDTGALERFYGKVTEAIHYDGSYVILLACDTYDVYTKGEDEDSGSSTVFTYIICSICPLKDTASGLCFRESDRLFHQIAANAVLGNPSLGFMFPAFDERQANIYHTLFYTRDLGNTYPDFISNIFGKEAPLPPKEQKLSFDSCMSAALGNECSYETVRSVYAQIGEIIEEHKESRDPTPLTLTKSTIATIVSNCGIDERSVDALGEKIDEHFGKNAEITPKNILTKGSMEIKLPDISVKVKPGKQDLVSTQIIDGKKYVMIEADGEVEVNGIMITV